MLPSAGHSVNPDGTVSMHDTQVKAGSAAGAAAPILGGIGTAIGGPVIGAAGTVLGGLISNLFNTRQRENAEEFQREFAQNAISWRVQDAKRAGIHPLYAMGANVPSGQPMVLGDALGEALGSGSQQIGNAVARMQTVDERMAMMQAYRLGESQIAETDARRDYYASMAARMSQEQNTGGLGIMPWEQLKKGMAGGMASQTPNIPGYTNMVEVKPAEIVQQMTGHPGVIAGNEGGYQEIILPGGMPFTLPVMKGESWQEHISEMSHRRLMGLLFMNQTLYGSKWLEDFFRHYVEGKNPMYSHTPISSGSWKAPESSKDHGAHILDFLRDSIYKESRKAK